MRDTNILVVDDDEDFAESLAEILEMSGLVVEVLHGGQDAIDRILSNNVDVLIMDLCMPYKDGLDVVRELRGKGKQLPTIIITACSDIEDVKKEQKEGTSIKAILSKPLNPEELLKLVNTSAKL